MNDLAKIEPQRQEMSRPSEVNVGQVIERMWEKGVSPDAAAAAMKSLVDLQNQQSDRWAKQSWVKAFAQVRAKCKTIQAEKFVPKKDANGNLKPAWWFAPMPDLQAAIEPLCEEAGLSVNWDSRREGNVVTGLCIVYHIDTGHSEQRQAAMNIANAQGGDMGAITTTQRKATTLMFGLKTEHMEPDDPRILGDFITPDEAEELETRCNRLNRPDYRVRLLKYLHSEDFGSVYHSRLNDARRSLEMAEARQNTVAVRPVVAGAVDVTVLDNTATTKTTPVAIPAPAGGQAVSAGPAGYNKETAGRKPVDAGREAGSDLGQVDGHGQVVTHPTSAGESEGNRQPSPNSLPSHTPASSPTATPGEIKRGRGRPRKVYPAVQQAAADDANNGCGDPTVGLSSVPPANSLSAPTVAAGALSAAVEPQPAATPGPDIAAMRSTLINAKLTRGTNQRLAMEACRDVNIDSIGNASDEQIIAGYQALLAKGYK